MFRDARAVPDRSTLDADICIVGGGAAGITIARELAGTGLAVLLLEAGGFEPDPATESLNEGESIGVKYRPVGTSRLRYLGGATQHWSGWCRPLDVIDFERRDDVPYSGWPFSRALLDPFYMRAQEICELGPYQYDPAYWESRGLGRQVHLRRDRFVSTVYQLSPPTFFGTAYRADLERADGVTVLLFANVVEIPCAENADAVTGLQVATLAGNRFAVRARQYVLAAGGLENARILLASRSTVPTGLGNQHDLVGRFFMEHLHINTAFFMPSDVPHDAAFYSRRQSFGRFGVIGALRLSDACLRQERLLGLSVFLEPAIFRPESVQQAQQADGYQSLVHLMDSVRNRRYPQGFLRHLWNVVTDPAATGTTTYWRLFMRGDGFQLAVRTEQAPNPDSRVTLSSDRDALGVPRIRLDWRLTDLDIRTIERGWELLAQELGRAGLGRVHMPETMVEQPWQDYLWGGAHHIGTTRMADDPRQGVVDRDSRVHGLANLYVAGSSVFPTGGFSNPTLTIVALALRLARHLKELPR